MAALKKYSAHKVSTYAWFLCSLVATFYCYEYLLRIQPSVMYAELMRRYALSAAAFGNLFAVYYYIYTPMQLPVGLLVDRYGPRMSLTLACLTCTVGTFIFAYANVLWLAELGRLLIGFGSAFAFVGALKVAFIWLPPNRFAMVAGLITAAGMIGGMVGSNLIALLVKNYGEQATVYGSAVCGLILSGLLGHYLRNRNSDDASLNKEIIPDHTFKDLLIHLIPLFKQRQIWLIAAIGGILYTSLSVFAELWGIPYLQQAKHFTLPQASFATSTVFLGWAAGGPVLGFLSGYFNNQRAPLIVGSLLGAIAISIVLYVNALSITLTAVLLFLFGIAASVEPIVFAIAKDSTEPYLTASACAVTNTFVMAVGMVLQPLVGQILDLGWDGSVINGVHHHGNVTFQLALVVIPVIFVISALLTLGLRKTYYKSS